MFRASALSSHGHEPMETSLIADFAVFHKTGYVLANSAIKRCFQDDVKFKPRGVKHNPFNFDRTTVVFVRDGLALTRSAYFYHLKGLEDWLFEKGYMQEHEWWTGDKHIMNHCLPNDSYYSFLQREKAWRGVRAEYRRSLYEFTDMLNISARCDLADNCMRVCLESFDASSASFNSTWSSILSFIGLDDSYLDCLSMMDMQSPNFKGDEEHATSGDNSESEVHKVDVLISKFDNKVGDKLMHKAAQSLGCANVQFNQGKLTGRPHIEDYA